MIGCPNAKPSLPPKQTPPAPTSTEQTKDTETKR